jgi:hypothetical protein
MIKYNTLYQSLKKVSAEWHAGTVLWEHSWNYLKFYEDGTVIYCSSNGNLKNINKWFDNENKDSHFSKGTYKIIRNNFIEIHLSAMIGSIKMDGVILDEKLILRSSNREMNLIESWDEFLISNEFI